MMTVTPVGNSAPVLIAWRAPPTESLSLSSTSPDWLKTVSFFVSFLENALRFPISFVVSIVRGAPVGEGASVFGWLKRANCMKTLSVFLLAPLELAGAGVMLNRAALELRCAPVELGHWLVNKRGPEVVPHGREPSESRTLRTGHEIWASGNGRPSSTGTALWPGPYSTSW